MSKTKEFKWTDENVKKFGDICHQDGWHKFHPQQHIDTLMEEFKERHSQPKYPEGIVELRSKLYNDLRIVLSTDGKYRRLDATNYSYTLDEIIKDWSIYTVKNSKGEEFSIGDKYKNMSGIFTIDSFIISGTIICAHAKEGGACDINCITKAKTPLFRTEDGVDVFEGDITYGVHIGTFEHCYNNEEPWKVGDKPDTIHKHFSTRLIAEAWIARNKPKFGEQQILDTLTKCTSQLYYCWQDEFKQKLGIK